MEKLIKDLEKAQLYLSQFKGGYSGKYICATEFHKDFKEELAKLKDGNKKSINQFYGWFLPTCEWDDFTNSDDESLGFGNSIFEQLSKLN